MTKEIQMQEAHTFARIVAYIIDIVIIIIIASAITMAFPKSTKYEAAQKEESNLISDYFDNKIDQNEFIDNMYEIRYKLEKESVAESMVSVALTFGYFAIFAFYNKGQTIGKKLLHLKVVSSDGNEASNIQFIGRSLIINGVLVSCVSLILLQFIKSNQFSYTVGLLEMIGSMIVIVSFFMILFRKDKKGLHDLICKTKVVECK